MTTKEIENKIIQRVDECLKKLYTIFDKYNVPVINFNLHGKSAGKAYLNDWEVRFNLKYAEQDLERFLNDTVPHEVAHLAEWYTSRTVGHKARWKGYMKILGVKNPKRCHNYVTNVHKFNPIFLGIPSHVEIQR